MSPMASHFGDDLNELRRRITIAFAAVCLASAGAWFFSRDISVFLMAPLFQACPDLAGLVYTNLTEAFVSYLKLAVLVGLIISFPVVLYQFWMFIAPGLRRDEKGLALKVVFWASILFAFGVCFAYFVVMPRALTFLMGFARDNLQALPKFDSYLTFVVRSSLAFGLAFEIPFLMVIAAKVSFVQRDYFASRRKYFYLAIVVVSFLLAAGELVSTILLALPLFLLYELGILIIRLFRVAAA